MVKKWATEGDAFQAASLHYSIVQRGALPTSDPETMRLLSEQRARQCGSMLTVG